MFFQNPLTAFARNYVAVKRPADKVSINPNIVTMGGIDTADKDNVIASQGLISRPLDNGLLVSSRYDSSKDSENWMYYNPAVFEPSILGRLPDYSIAMRLCCGFADVDQISGEALEAMKRAVSVKLYEGFEEDGTLRPAGQTTRAQMAKLLNVLCGSVCEHAAAGTRGLCVVSKAVPPLALAGGGTVCGL